MDNGNDHSHMTQSRLLLSVTALVLRPAALLSLPCQTRPLRPEPQRSRLRTRVPRRSRRDCSPASGYLDPADAAALLTDLHALPPNDGGTLGCGLDTGYRVQIEAEVAGTTLVFSDGWACSEVCVTRGGASLLTLTSTPASENEITLLIGSPPLP
jgi:hypothetical protein